MKPTFLNRLGYSRDNLVSWCGVLSLVILWCLLTYTRLVRKVFLPTPTGIWEGIMDYYHRGWLLAALGRSFRRVSLALAFVVGIGAPVGVVMGAFPDVDAFLRKLVNAGKSLPTTGLAGLIVLWFGIDERGKTVYLFLGALFYMILLTRNAVANVSEDYIAVANALGASRSQRIWRVLVPGVLLKIWEAIAVSTASCGPTSSWRSLSAPNKAPWAWVICFSLAVAATIRVRYSGC